MDIVFAHLCVVPSQAQHMDGLQLDLGFWLRNV